MPIVPAYVRPAALWRRQPEGSSRLDPSHPLASGMKFLGTPNNGPRDLVVGTPTWTDLGLIPPVVRRTRGLIWGMQADGESWQYTGNENITGNIGTFFVAMHETSGAGLNGHVLWGTNTTTAVPFFMAAGGGVQGWGQDINGATSTSYFNNPNFQTIVMSSRDGTAAGVNYWNNGKLNANGAGGVAPSSFASGAKYFRIGAWAASAGFNVQGEMLLIGYTSRAWGESEARAFHDNPWQMFEPQPSRSVYFFATATDTLFAQACL